MSTARPSPSCAPFYVFAHAAHIGCSIIHSTAHRAGVSSSGGACVIVSAACGIAAPDRGATTSLLPTYSPDIICGCGRLSCPIPQHPLFARELAAQAASTPGDGGWLGRCGGRDRPIDACPAALADAFAGRCGRRWAASRPCCCLGCTIYIGCGVLYTHRVCQPPATDGVHAAVAGVTKGEGRPATSCKGNASATSRF